ncbi:YwmB family TATA-box binding protein [Bacillus aquiflavi]|uniref:YwmB family TATA-box binding protein n=1 Tax=Bacillus aquiflavi TaxID=2672567 RepID=A0A6B3VXN3_9BACI|nr:YwmB family TATA-box binding protein [Bacillus aquiflavi]MBA4536657.1 YwmB family TATA-box binding protein [Bacillus aquiflavi]NEY81025.1 YwmB family TATA-box binding protein [Bacillus aquiflavi]UAC47904.1 YwmB family TATA-box binding protein [Bacillus aquiflavi]
MNKISLTALLISIILFSFFFLENTATIANNKMDLAILAETLQDEDVVIKEWSLHARKITPEMNSKEEINQFFKQLKKQFPEWDWTTKKSERHYEIKGELLNLSSQPYNETIHLRSSANKNKFETYITYEIKGYKWSKEAELFVSKIAKKKIDDIFRGNVTIFSCIKGEFSDRIEKALSRKANKFLTILDGEEIEALSEDSFVSVSAYTPLLGEVISNETNKMNLQLALRTEGLGARTTIVVGTPIITVEY